MSYDDEYDHLPAYDLDKRTGKPTRVMAALDPSDLFKTMPPSLRKRCRCAYLQGRIESLEELGMGSDGARRHLAALENEAA